MADDPLGLDEGSSLDEGLLDDISDSEIWDIVTEETPGIGRLKRLYRYVKRALAREYIREIKQLKKKEDTLISAMRDQTTIIALQRRQIRELESKLEKSGGDKKRPPG
jgi:hypothetical protein